MQFITRHAITQITQEIIKFLCLSSIEKNDLNIQELGVEEWIVKLVPCSGWRGSQ